MKKLSIIIVTYNSEDHIFDCVRSILQFADLPKEQLELIIVDNCSRSPQPMFADLRLLWGDDIICLSNTSNGGYGQGNNLGLLHASAPFALIMNPDVRLIQPVFRTVCLQFQSHPHLGIIGMKQMLTDHQPSNNSISATWLVNGYLRAAINFLSNRINLFIPSIMYVQGSCFFLRKEMFLLAGAFDDTHFMYGEEEDIHYRMKQSFSARCFAYRSDLHYLHLASNRRPSLSYEQQLLQANLALYAKKGISSNRICRHFRQNLRLLIFRNRLLRHADALRVQRALLSYINHLTNN